LGIRKYALPEVFDCGSYPLRGKLFVYLKLSAFHNFTGWIPELENVDSTEEIGEIYNILLVGQVELEHFFAQKIKELNGIIPIVLPGEIFECDEGAGWVWVKTYCGHRTVIGKARTAALGSDAGRDAKNHRENKVKNPHSLLDKIPSIQYSKNLPKIQKLPDTRHILKFSRPLDRQAVS
jgi:hypothetical protein